MSDNVTETTVVAPEESSVLEPPKTFGGIFKQLGPGLMIEASIVGSGELIATTKTGAKAGMSLLWLIIIGCLIKVFVQIELGRNAIGQGKTTLTALNEVPGPRMRVNWILWFWLLMMLVGFGQLGGIVGGVGQAFVTLGGRRIVGAHRSGTFCGEGMVPVAAEGTRHAHRGGVARLYGAPS